VELVKLLDRIATAAVLTDPGDLPALVALQDQLQSLARLAAEDDLAALAELGESSARIIDEIVMRTAPDSMKAFRTICEGIESAQLIVRSVIGESGEAPPATSSPPTQAPQEVDQELLDAWISGSADALAALENALVAIDSGEDEADQIGEARRIIHTFKGEAGVLSLHIVQRVCHEAESLIDARRTSGAGFPVDCILSVVDWMRRAVESLASGHFEVPDASDILSIIASAATSPEGSSVPSPSESRDTLPGASQGQHPNSAGSSPKPSEPAAAARSDAQHSTAAAEGDLVQFGDYPRDENLADFITESREHLAGAEAALLQLEGDRQSTELVNTIFRAFHTIKGVAGFMHLTPIVELAHVAETLLDHARNARLVLTPPYMELVFQSTDMLSRLIAVLEGATAPTTQVLRSLIHRLEQANTLLPLETSTCEGPAPIEARRTAPPPSTAEHADLPAESAAADSPSAVAASTGHMRRVADQTVKVSTHRMDSLVTMVGELVISQQMIVQDPQVQGISDQRLQRNLAQVGKIIRDLQSVSMSLRMVTVKGCFQKMARLVRDISLKAGKKIQFVMEGEDTELDRTIVDEIGDPLIHMVRNACDHGIEPAADRIACGKPESGTLSLRAYHQGGSIVIEIADDGRGLDRARILRKAVERGLIPGDRNLDEISDNEAYNLIFMPGFSTAEKITDISGRGVGMDVVKRNLEALRGKVEIRSEFGKGTTFLLWLPLTMAIIDGMVVRVGSQRYVVPTHAIEQSFRPGDNDLHTTVQRGEMAMVRGSLLPIYRLNRTLALREGVDELTRALLLVLDSAEGRCCLAVDEILGQQQVVIKSLGQGLPRLRGVSGGAILGDGRVALILDVSGIVGEATQAAA